MSHSWPRRRLPLSAVLVISALVPVTSPSAHKKVPKDDNVLDELVVDLDDRVDDRGVARLEARYNVRLVPVSKNVSSHRIYKVYEVETQHFQKRESSTRLLTFLRRDRAVEAADLSYIYHLPEIAPASLTRAEAEGVRLPHLVSNRGGAFDSGDQVIPNDPKYKYQWHLDQLRMPRAWRHGQGQGVVVAVIDTGVTPVEDLRGTAFVPGWNFVDNNGDTRDDHGHGTHVAGTIAQTTHNGIGVAGVAYKARIMPIKVLSAQGSGTVGGIADGIRWAVDHGANVINMSLGGRFHSQVLAKAVKYAYDKGVVVVCAAGNDGRNKVSYPAANEGAIAVAATQYDESTTFYSNWGKEIAIAAPGGNTRVDQNGDGVPDGVLQNTVTPGNIEKEDYLLFMGTSMAAPHVAGVAALVFSTGVHKPSRIRQILERSARKPAKYHGPGDEHYGAGIVDAEAAIKMALATPGGKGVAYAHRCPQDAERSNPGGVRLTLLGLSFGLAVLLRRRIRRVVLPA